MSIRLRLSNVRRLLLFGMKKVRGAIVERRWWGGRWWGGAMVGERWRGGAMVGERWRGGVMVGGVVV
jgi:hypothetical protein